MGIKDLPRDAIVRAKEAFDYAGVLVHKGALAHAGHAIVQEREHLFEELAVHFKNGDAYAEQIEAKAKAAAEAAEAKAKAELEAKESEAKDAEKDLELEAGNVVDEAEHKAQDVVDAVVPAAKQGAASVVAAAKKAANAPKGA